MKLQDSSSYRENLFFEWTGKVAQGHKKCKDSEVLSELDLSATVLHIIGALTGARGEAVVE